MLIPLLRFAIEVLFLDVLTETEVLLTVLGGVLTHALSGTSGEHETGLKWGEIGQSRIARYLRSLSQSYSSLKIFEINTRDGTAKSIASPN